MVEENKIYYIPAQEDILAGTSPPTARNTPFRLTWRDVRTFFSLTHLLPKIFCPFRTSQATDELSWDSNNLRYQVCLLLITLTQAFLFSIVLFGLVWFPGFLSIPIASASSAFIWALCYPLQGPRIVYSKLTEESLNTARRRTDERWIFINGILVS